MTPKQMYRMMREHGISLVLWPPDYNSWVAIDSRQASYDPPSECIHLEPSTHVDRTPESAVEDYCNARNIEWDRD